MILRINKLKIDKTQREVITPYKNVMMGVAIKNRTCNRYNWHMNIEVIPKSLLIKVFINFTKI